MEEQKPNIDFLMVRLGNKLWRLQYADDLKGDVGSTDRPNRIRKKIQIKTMQTEKEELDTLLHECRHAQNWNESETAVARDAKELTEILWTLGWRRDPSLSPIFNVQPGDFSDDPPCEESHA